MIGLVTLDFWQTLFADTRDSLRRAHALRLEGVRETLAEAGRLYAAAELAAADARAGDAFTAVWREHRDMAPDEQLRMFLDALDPALPATLDPGTLGRIARVVPGAGADAPPGDHPRGRGGRARAPGRAASGWA